jgi:serpin B
LEIVLKDLDLTYMIRDEVLMITTRDIEDYNQTTRIHDVSDLPAYRTEDGRIIPDYDGLILTIRKTISPRSWADVGGAGSIDLFYAAGIQALVVNQTSPVHEQIDELLDNLRKLRKTPLTKDDLEKLPPPPAPLSSSLEGMMRMSEKKVTPVEKLPPLDPDPAREAIVQANNQFAFRLYSQLCEKDRNLFFSPYSIATVLAMAHAGARGETAEEMAKTLCFSLKQENIPQGYQSLLNATLLADRPGCEMNVANRLWCQKDYKFRQSFLDINQNQFNSEIGLVDFKQCEAVRKLMNDWIEEKTKQRIKDAVQPGAVHEMTRFAITNAIYFKGKWEDSFSKQNTKDQPFYADDKTVNVPMMSLTDTRHRYAEIDGLQILEKNYLGGDVSMLILLPTKQHASLASVESMLNAEQLKEWTEALGKRAVEVYLPRFKMETFYPLIPALEKLGMHKAFSLKEADFSGIKEESEPLAIDTLFHKTILQVDEEGTEAAVASMGMGFGGPVAALKPPVFRADHPFLFLIRDTRTGCILFIGRVMLPPKDAEN